MRMANESAGTTRRGWWLGWWLAHSTRPSPVAPLTPWPRPTPLESSTTAHCNVEANMHAGSCTPATHADLRRLRRRLDSCSSEGKAKRKGPKESQRRSGPKRDKRVKSRSCTAIDYSNLLSLSTYRTTEITWFDWKQRSGRWRCWRKRATHFAAAGLKPS